MKRFIAALLCALTAAAFTSCKHKIKDNDSSSQAPTGKKSSFIIEEVTD